VQANEYACYGFAFASGIAAGAAEVQRIHGSLRRALWLKAGNLPDVLRDLNSAIEASEILIAHNLKFDERVLSAEFLRMNLQPPFLHKIHGHSFFLSFFSLISQVRH
jgi:hypothetical protein